MHNVHKCAFVHISLFLDFGGSDLIRIAYDYSSKCFSTSGAGFSSCINSVHAQCALIVHICTLAFLSILVAWIDSILHIMVVLNVSQHVVLVRVLA